VIEATDRGLVWRFFNERLGLHASEDFRGVLHVPEQYKGAPMSADHVAIAVAYNNFVGKTCCMHTVIQRPDMVTRRIVRESFAYPFQTCGCNAVIALVDSVNEAALSFDKKLGFVEVARVPGGGIDGDLIILQMLRGDCRWLRAH
jgi:hypothetical protein